MFENLLHQNVTSLLARDIKNDKLPGAILLSGTQSSGKLTCALEIARILSCTEKNKGSWTCKCPSCLQHKSLVSNNLIIAGPRDCTPEIQAATKAFLQALTNNSAYLTAARYLFLRSIRKLTSRFNQILWQDDDKLNKIASIMSSIDEEIEPLDFPHELMEFENVQKSCEKLLKLCESLESDFLYDSIPISQIRNASSWARLKSIEGKKTIIIENADRMLEGVRNALLKILEEPPSDTVFILITSKRNAVMPTILSRVRTYNFSTRTLEQEKEVIERVFHAPDFNRSIDEYLLTFLPVSPVELRKRGTDFFDSIVRGSIPKLSELIKDCGNFEPRIMLKIFFNEILEHSKKVLTASSGSQASFALTIAIRDSWNNITVYNQSVISALEVLVREISKINKIYGNVLSWVVM